MSTMGRTKRTRSQSNKTNETASQGSDQVDIENVNDNHMSQESQSGTSRRRNLSGEKVSSPKVKKVKLHEVKKKAKSDSVTFVEDDTQFEMEVGHDVSQFPSDDDMDHSQEEEQQDPNPVSHKSEDNKTDGSDLSTDESSDASSDESESESEPEPKQSPAAKCKVKKVKRQSLQDQTGSLSSSLHEMQQLFMEGGILKASKAKAKMKDRDVVQDRRSHSRSAGKLTISSNSEATIYDCAVPLGDDFEQEVDTEITFNLSKKRDSSSSEDQDKVDTSDELIEVDHPYSTISDRDPIRSVVRRSDPARQSMGAPFPRQDRGEEKIRELEASRARVNQVKGTCAITEFGQLELSLQIDENYMALGSHIDQNLCNKIVNFEYVDLAKLLPKDKIVKEEDHRMEIVNRGGSTFFVPVSDHEMTAIGSYHRWETAFRVYSTVITSTFPHKASELLQYNHVIFSASQTFLWDNVYSYDKEFRMHIANYPHRSWNNILQQAWSLCLKDKIEKSKWVESGKQKGKKKDTCLRFNKGLYRNGPGCQYDHRCLECGKFGHGQHICRNKQQTNTGQTDHQIKGANGGARNGSDKR